MTYPFMMGAGMATETKTPLRRLLEQEDRDSFGDEYLEVLRGHAQAFVIELRLTDIEAAYERAEDLLDLEQLIEVCDLSLKIAEAQTRRGNELSKPDARGRYHDQARKHRAVNKRAGMRMMELFKLRR